MTDESTSVSNGEALHQNARISFTGSGSEYFRIWIVNLFLTYLTLGIYSAWAKVRREKYFHQNTVIAGHSLDYHGNPIAILKGRVVGFLLLALYTGSGTVPAVSVIALGLIVLVMPFLMQRSVRFRFANSSYRGIRFGFTGTAKEAYRTLLPFMLLPLAFAGTLMVMFLNPEAIAELWKSMPRAYAVAAGAAGLLAGLGSIVFYALLHATWRRFSINHAHFGMVKGNTTITGKQYLWIYLSSLLILILIFGAIITAIAGFGFLAIALSPAVIALLPIAFVTLYLIIFAMQGVLLARLQNYCWNKATDVRSPNNHQLAWFNSDLSITSYGLLQFKNWALTFVTLGLYRPYAVVNSTKARLQAVSLSSSRFIDYVIGAENENPSAIGEEALDAFDLDFSI
jgi:uncharacterized membrane protein YjgN (DUF898 family)